MNGILTMISAILIFALMIFVHELGHFISAKLSKIKVSEFALGMGPAVFKRQSKETLYSIRIIPFGGYCKMEDEESLWDTSTSFTKKPAWIRFVVLVAGSFMNILLGFVLAMFLYASLPQIPTNIIAEVIPDTAAYKAGMTAEDRIVKLDGEPVRTYSDLTREIAKLISPRQVEVLVENNGMKRALMITPEKGEAGRPSFGFKLKMEPTTFTTVVRDAYYETIGVTKFIYWSISQLIAKNVSPSDLSGPVGIVNEINKAVSQGMRSLIILTILLTVNLGVMNLLPIPGLDGGRILFLLIEVIRRKPLPPEKEGWVHFAGFALLIIFSVFVLYNDIIRLTG